MLQLLLLLELTTRPLDGMTQLSTPSPLTVMMHHTSAEQAHQLLATVMVLSGLDHSRDQIKLTSRSPNLPTCSSGELPTRSLKTTLHALLRKWVQTHCQMDQSNAGASQSQNTSQLDVLMRDKIASAQVLFSSDHRRERTERSFHSKICLILRALLSIASTTPTQSLAPTPPWELTQPEEYSSNATVTRRGKSLPPTRSLLTDNSGEPSSSLKRLRDN